MDNPGTSLLDKKISPFIQLLFVLAMTLILIGFTSLSPKVPYSSTSGIMPWVVICGMILFYALVNSVLSFGAENGSTYWLHSIISFSILLVVGGLLAWSVSGVSIQNAGSVKWLYFVFTFGYLVFLSIVNLIKFLVVLAKRQDHRLRGED